MSARAEQVIAQALDRFGPDIPERIARYVIHALEVEGLTFESSECQTEPKVEVPSADTREALRVAIGSVTSNASNFPEKVQARLLGQDMAPLTEKLVDAVVGAVIPVTGPQVGRAWVSLFGKHPTVTVEEVRAALEAASTPPTPGVARSPRGTRAIAAPEPDAPTPSQPRAARSSSASAEAATR